MKFLLDTNIILRLAEPKHPMYPLALNGLSYLTRNHHEYFIIHQNLIEFWRTCTRPKDKNGLGMTIEKANIELTKLEQLFPVLPDCQEIYPQWRNLVIKYKVKGVNVHDARLVAAMLVHNLTHILTFNSDDFKRYSEITIVNPKNINN